MHAKFITIRSGGMTRVITLSSNIGRQQFRLAQDSLTITNDGALYNGYTSYWNQLKRREWNSGSRWNATTANNRRQAGADGRTVFFFPQNSAVDPLKGVIDETACSGDSSTDEIRMLASEEFRTPLLESLAAARARGCSVNVTVQSKARMKALLSQMRVLIKQAQSHEGGVPLVPVSRGDISIRRVHSKAVYIRDKDGNATALTGSHNTNYCLDAQNDTMLRLDNPSLASWYREFIVMNQ
jgi:phosphatidylserine/phosphatidylglycerophosphate/cardiolipin synthase-like enzyme